jgi:hypothetical protein
MIIKPQYWIENKQLHIRIKDSANKLIFGKLQIIIGRNGRQLVAGINISSQNSRNTNCSHTPRQSQKKCRKIHYTISFAFVNINSSYIELKTHTQKNALAASTRLTVQV